MNQYHELLYNALLLYNAIKCNSPTTNTNSLELVVTVIISDTAFSAVIAMYSIKL